MENLMLIQVI